jgi:hypothetical protein
MLYHTDIAKRAFGGKAGVTGRDRLLPGGSAASFAVRQGVFQAGDPMARAMRLACS